MVAGWRRWPNQSVVFGAGLEERDLHISPWYLWLGCGPS